MSQHSKENSFSIGWNVQIGMCDVCHCIPVENCKIWTKRSTFVFGAEELVELTTVTELDPAQLVHHPETPDLPTAIGQTTRLDGLVTLH